MSQFATVMTPAGADSVVADVLTLAVSGEISIPSNQKFSVTAYDANLNAVPFTVAYGKTADADSDFFPPGKWTMQGSRGWDTITIFNPTAATMTYCVTFYNNS